jgi:hypothetical protein
MRSGHRFNLLAGRQVALGMIGDHFDAAGDLATVLDLQAPAAGGAKDLATAADDQAATRGQRAVDGAGDFGLLHLDLTLEHAARRDREFGGVDHRCFDGALDDEELSVLDDTLDTDAASDDQGATV